MDKNRILELAGLSKAVGTREVFMLNESKKPLNENAAKQFVRGLEIYQHAIKDPRSKPAALKAAMAFVNDVGDGPVSPQAGKFIEDQLGNILNDANPRGAMMSGDDEEPDATDEFGEDPAEVSNSPEEKLAKVVAAGQRRKEAAARPKQSRIPVGDAVSWLRQNPNATAKEFVTKAVEAGINPKTARAKFYKEKKKMATRAALTGESVSCYIIKKGEDILSERSRPLIPHWIKDDDFNSEFYVFETRKQAEEARDNFILHVSEQMEIVELDEEIEVKKSLSELNQAGTMDSDYEVGEVDPNQMHPQEERALKIRSVYNKIKHQYRNPARAMQAAEHAVDSGEG